MRNPDRAPSPAFTRREILTLGIGAFVVGSIPLAGRGRQELVRRTMPVMGTIAELAVIHRDPRQAHAAVDAALEELQAVERLMTRFSEASDVGRANRLAATRPVSVSPQTAAVLREALAWAEASAGEFDPCIGRAIRLWDVGQRRTPPPEEAVRPLAGRSLYRGLDLETWRGSPVVRFRDPGIEVDLGGIAKGHGVDAAVQALRRRGITQAIVNVGGDLFALGGSETGEPWQVGIRSPDDPSRLAGELAVSDGAVATSGDYLQYFSHGGRRYHHLLDPTTAAPRRTAMHSVTVSASTCLAADAAATAVYGMAPERAERLLRARAPGARIVTAIAGEA
ncbi:MAG: hypothetical protein A2X52_01790 [Candidatus Rokubacteria bacterium GWC2_70_16]|nr:MAG: hypothetical protein A2X52_01790 [Candidatus Rokubacteria bacterium GWC2_70_16]